MHYHSHSFTPQMRYLSTLVVSHLLKGHAAIFGRLLQHDWWEYM